ncbi:MAG TPA: hypothetical protein DD405_05695 [Desulfobacteraceae bacterium]|nr:hypothetical protein [Desulfobacteraceae bacterium]
MGNFLEVPLCPFKRRTYRIVVGWILSVNGAINYHFFDWCNAAAIENPVNVIAVLASCKTMVGGGKGLIKNIFKKWVFKFIIPAGK